MGRPREHNEQTAAELLDAAERIVEASGLQALSVRRVADEVGTTTRAVYSSFGSKDGLVAALGARAFHLLGERVRRLPVTADPAADLVEAGVRGFRRFATAHPALFRLAVQRTDVNAEMAASFRAAADEAMTRLLSRIEALHAADLLGDRTARDAACEFHALCEGLAALELRGIMDDKRAEPIWRDALGSLVAGFAHAPDPALPSGKTAVR
jgi:AcrR family transcriptional regulator